MDDIKKLYRKKCLCLIDEINKVLEQYHRFDALMKDTCQELWDNFDQCLKQDLFTKENLSLLLQLRADINAHIRFISEYNESIYDYML